MFYDLMFSLGGDFLVRLADSIMGPLFGFVCTMETNVGGVWGPLATFFEQILS